MGEIVGLALALPTAVTSRSAADFLLTLLPMAVAHTHLALEDLVKVIGLPKEKLCTYCWDGCEGCGTVKKAAPAEEA